MIYFLDLFLFHGGIPPPYADDHFHARWDWVIKTIVSITTESSRKPTYIGILSSLSMKSSSNSVSTRDQIVT
jgi:hypothetical protein